MKKIEQIIKAFDDDRYEINFVTDDGLKSVSAIWGNNICAKTNKHKKGYNVYIFDDTTDFKFSFDESDEDNITLIEDTFIVRNVAFKITPRKIPEFSFNKQEL